MANRLQTCADCKFFEAKPNNNGLGLCHRYPPQVAGSFVGSPGPRPGEIQGKIANDTFWPMVPTSAWCGEYIINTALLLKTAN